MNWFDEMSAAFDAICSDMVSDGIVYHCNYHQDRRAMLAHGLALASYAAISPGPILEIGTDTCAGAIALGLGARINSCHPPVATCDIRRDVIAAARRRLDACGLDDVEVIDRLQRSLAEAFQEKLGLVFVDGSHSYGDVLLDLRIVAKLMASRGTVLVHDFFDGRGWWRLASNGVPRAIGAFLCEHPTWRGCRAQEGFYMLSPCEYDPTFYVRRIP